VRVVLTGASGLLGTALRSSLDADGVEVTQLVRGEPAAVTQVHWDPRARAGGLDPAVLSGADAVVHLSGAPVAGGRWTAARKKELRDSRIVSTGSLIEAMLAAPVPPPVLLCGSAVGWYGSTGDREVDEKAPVGTGFLARLVEDWEAATAPASAAGLRVVNLRSGVVLSGKGGMLGPLAPLFKLGLGARLGDGKQYLSWIEIADWVGAARFLLGASEIAGPVNLTAPEPATNAQFTAAFAAAVHRPALLWVPKPLIELGLGELSGELLGSARVIPARLEQAGFAFRYPAIGPAISAALS
jgi:uncharacterized protein